MKLAYHVNFFSVLLMCLSVISCKKTEEYNVDYKYEYFPKDTGHYVIYDVDSITFNDFFDPPISDTATYQIMEVIESIFEDNEGRPSCRIERYRRQDADSSWDLVDVWFANRTFNTGERIEENLRFVKLIFPPQRELTWDGNNFIDVDEGVEYLQDWEYRYTEVDVPASVGGLTFDSTLTVLQSDYESLINKRYSVEQYAKHVGFIYKELAILEKLEILAPWTQPSSGFILKMRINDYGSI